MTMLDVAREADRERRLVEAAEAYERVMRDEMPELDVYLDAAVLYMEASDFGVASGLHLPDAFYQVAIPNALRALENARARFGEQPDIAFWTRYVRWICLGPDIDLAEALALERAGAKDVYLYLAQVDEVAPQFAAQSAALLESVSEERTERERYLKSVLDSALGTNRKRLEALRSADQP